MNSERRHELQQNALAHHLARINESIEPYSKPIAIFVGLGIVAGIAFALFQSNVAGQRSDATLQLIQANGENDADILAMVGDNYAETPAGTWARLYQADTLMSRGMRVLYNNREEAEQLLGDAKTAYEQALSSGDDKMLRSRAHFGLARVAEALGDPKEAIAQYRETMAQNESEAMVEVAQQRIDLLSSARTEEFFAWFKDQDFSPPDPAMPPSLPSGTTLPDLPDLDLPEIEAPAAAEAPAGEKGEAAAQPSEPAMQLKEPAIEMPADAKVAPPAEPAAAAEPTPAVEPAAAAEPAKMVEPAPATEPAPAPATEPAPAPATEPAPAPATEPAPAPATEPAPAPATEPAPASEPSP